MIGELAQVGLHLGNGYAGEVATMRDLREVAARTGARASTHRLLAEGAYVRGELDGARQGLEEALKLELGHPRTVVNIGVVRALRDDAQGAESTWRIAVMLADERGAAAAGAVARWNLARLDGDKAAMKTAVARMAHRDRVRVQALGDAAPLWAMCAFTDLLDAMTGSRDFGARVFGSLATAMGHGLGSLLQFAFGADPLGDSPGQQTVAGLATGAGHVALLFLVLSLLWLPLPVRPLHASAATAAGRRFARTRRSLRALSAIVPGLPDLLRGSPGRGALLLTIAVACWTLWQCVFPGGVLSRVAMLGYSRGYFAGVADTVAFPGLEWLGTGAAAVGIALVVIHAAWQGWRRMNPDAGPR